MIDVTLYEADGTFVDTLTATDALPNVDGTRSVRRTANFTVSISELADLRVYGRLIKMTERSTGGVLFTGYYDDVVAIANMEEGTVRVACRDKSKKLKEAGFDEDTSFLGNGATTTRAISSASATSELSAGYEIQGYADVYEQTVVVYDLGVAKRVNDATVTGDIRDGDMSITASGSNVQKVVLDVYLDLKATENLQQIRLDNTGYAESIEISTDAVTWAAYTTGVATARYIHIQITGTLTFTAEIKVYAGASYPASNALADNENSWRPSLSDLQREITLDIGSSQQVNVLYLRWGLNDAERRTLVNYEVFAQVNNRWMSLGAWYSNSGLAEAVFDTVAARYFKIRVINTWEGRPALRYVKIEYCTSTQTIDYIIKTVAQGESETEFNLTPTKRRTKMTFEAGQKKWDGLQEMVRNVLGNWELFYSVDGTLTLKPKVLRTDQAKEITAMLPPFTITFSDADVKNEIIAIYEGQNNTLRHVVKNENAAGSTSIPRIGRRTEVVRSSLADTADKLATFAQRELSTRGRVTTPAEATVAAAAGYEPYDIWSVTESKTGTSGLFILTGFNITANKEQATYDLRAKLEAV